MDRLVVSRRISRDVALCCLKEGGVAAALGRRPYRVLRIAGKPSGGRSRFVTTAGIRWEINARHGRAVEINPAFRLQQWLAAEALIEARWPAYVTHTVPAKLIDDLTLSEDRA